MGAWSDVDEEVTARMLADPECNSPRAAVLERGQAGSFKSIPKSLIIGTTLTAAVLVLKGLNARTQDRLVDAMATESLAQTTCAKIGDGCTESKGCCDASLKCFRKNPWYAVCMASCDRNLAQQDGSKWSCDIVSANSEPHATPVAQTATQTQSASDGSLPACADPTDKACVSAKCSVSDGGPEGDCLKTLCCRVPGNQCYRQNEWWAGCKPACDPNADTAYAGKGWSCEKLGPRTPGDTHSWKPCPREAEKHPLLLDGDVPAAWSAAEKRAKALVATLHLEDKVLLLNGQNDPWPNDRHGYAGYINPNFNFRNKCAMPLMLNDGPQGYNHYQKKLAGTTTQFPSLLTLAATFDAEASRRYAKAISTEFVQKGANVMLGPDVEVGRNALSGRAFETLSGEDPYLGSELVRPFVQETLKRGIIVTIKHWLDNNEEDYRQTMSVEVPSRAQHEIYMPVFKAAIEEGAGAVMCSYQKVDGTHACANEHLLKKLLRDDLGFKGFVMSDWGATHDALKSARSGLDMEMPGGNESHFAKLKDLVKQGHLPESTIDEMATHVLSAMYATGLFDGKFPWTTGEAALDSDVTSADHREVAKRTIIDGAVLLKNKMDVLPLGPMPGKIAMVGKYCNQALDSSYGQGDVFSGGGSGWVMSNKQVTPYHGVKEHFSSSEVTWGTSASDALEANVAIVCASAHAEEGWDRANLTLPEAAELVKALKAQSPLQKVIVLAISPGVVTTDWIDEADAGLLLFMPGEQVGPAVAELLSGDVGPGGRLPVSLPTQSEHRFTKEQYPGYPFNDKNMVTQWSEGVLVGYLWNDAKDIPSAFPFGFGLSYTTFALSDFQTTCDPAAESATVSFRVSNSGLRGGAAVPQLYVGFPSLRPSLRRLRAFRKVQLDSAEGVIVKFTLGPADWSFWNVQTRGWQSAARLGEEIKLHIGTSSADLSWSSNLGCVFPPITPA
mmetsp:Transcript_24766/g.71053  ORF Transcript_24766/g.71053 Transcript_24766/m.71053 type:complete len:954 (+) Transcript_24766:50-2911(+)